MLNEESGAQPESGEGRFQLVFEGCTPDDLDVRLLAEAVTCLIERLVKVEGLQVVMASDFAEAVRSRVDDPDYAAWYQATRVTGLASAKTIPGPEGRWSVVVDARMVAPGAGERFDVRRLFAHEGATM